jgi:hypothetical protein
MTIKRTLLLIVVLMLFLVFTGCLLEVKDDVDYPAGLFEKTLKKLEKIHAEDPGRKGKVSALHMLIYAGDERKLITFSVPAELAKSTMESVDLGSIKDKNLEKYHKAVGDVDLKKLKDLDRLGPGMLAEIMVEEKDGNVHILMWLE